MGRIDRRGCAAVPPPQATRKGAMAKAVATPFDKACDMPLSPIV
ncbi:hypothetical protein C7S15_0524 [Burkholderia cepacia]|nr:hypothetical protein [Burkholderia cepacia]